MNLLNGFRKLTPAERADVEGVFGSSLDYEHIYLSTDSPTNRIFFGIQDFFTGNPDSRAFTTGNLINVDVGDPPINRPTLVHESTHVWQNQNVGPIYMDATNSSRNVCVSPIAGPPSTCTATPLIIHFAVWHAEQLRPRMSRPSTCSRFFT